MQIEVTRKPAEADAATLSRGIQDFNALTVPDLEAVEDEVRFFVLARDEDGALIGGMRACCYWNTLHIELTWLSDAGRGRGMGKRLMQAAEEKARALGCEKALVETTSWQARGFYEKCGYALLATLEGRPKGHASHYLAKELGT